MTPERALLIAIAFELAGLAWLGVLIVCQLAAANARGERMARAAEDNDAAITALERQADALRGYETEAGSGIGDH